MAEALRKTFEDSAKLSSFAGYGTYQVAVKSALKSDEPFVPVTAMFVGVAPDGQKFTSSSKMLSSGFDESGLFVVNARAGTRPFFSEIQYNVDLSSEVLRGQPSVTQETDEPAGWAGAEVVHLVGRALLPAKDEDGNAINLFGGPVDTSNSSVVVAFGEPQENGAITGFGAEVSSDNKVGKLLVPRKGSVLKITPSLVAASTFQGSFPLQRSVASPFSGVFMQLEEGEVRGFGSLIPSKTASVPVEVYVADSEDAGDPPATADVPTEPLVVWSGLSTGTVTLQLTDMPSQLNLTTVKLFRGDSSTPVAIAEASADGKVVFSTKGLAAASDYTVQVERQFISGTPQLSDRSAEFEISVRVLPAYTYQMLVGPSEGAVARNGLTYQGRLTLTTTSAGRVSGRLEWVKLAQVRDGSGQVSEYTFSSDHGESSVFIPSLVSSPLTGQLSVAVADEEDTDTEDIGLNALAADIVIPTMKGQSGHQLRVIISDAQAEIGDTAWIAGGSIDSIALLARATLELDPSFGEESLQYGVAYAATKSAASASGEYRTVSLREEFGEPINNHSHTIRYAGGSTAMYTFQTGAKSAKLTSTANVSVAGDIPLLICGAVAKYKMGYENASGKSVFANMATLVAGVMSPTISLNVDDERYWISGARVDAAGCDLEVSAKTAGGYVLRDDWKDLFEQVGFSAVYRTASTKRYVDFNQEQKIQKDVPYTFEVVLDDEIVLSDTVTFGPSGSATFSDTDNGKMVSLNATFANGTIVAQIKLRDGVLDPTGKPVKSSGFAMPATPVLGWGGVEGGDVGWRIRQ
jgi:hypothetical protein